MDWVKRNLGFVVGGVVAIGLLLFSGYYLYSNSKKNNDARAQLEGEYNELQRLSNLKPHPGKGDVDNIQRATEQKVQVLEYVEKMRQRFKPIPALPPSAEVRGEEFSAYLRRTIDQLNRQASVASVLVPTNYNFSFEAEKRLVKFAPGSLNALAVQLGEVKAICEILFSAKVNKLTGLRRERVSPDDLTGPQSDYLWGSSVTNELAVISPYEISFESFSSELAGVMSGFANSPHGIVIKGLNVRRAQAVSPRRGVAGAPRPYAQPYTPPTQTYRSPIPDTSRSSQPSYVPPIVRTERYRDRLSDSDLTVPSRTTQPYVQPYTQPRDAYPAGVVAPGRAQTLIDAHPLSVTLAVEVIKLLPPQEE